MELPFPYGLIGEGREFCDFMDVKLREFLHKIFFFVRSLLFVRPEGKLRDFIEGLYCLTVLGYSGFS